MSPSRAAVSILAHRGFAAPSGTGQENTLAAFARALEAGADILESDVRVTADGHAVLLHDEDFLPAGSDTPRTLATLRLDELTGLPLPNGETIPSLAAALAAFPSAHWNLDVKEAAAEPAIASAVLSAGAADRVLISSFSRGRRRRTLASIGPGAKTSGSVPESAAILLAAALGCTRLLGRLTRSLHAVQLPETGVAGRLLTPRVIARILATGTEVHLWTVNEPERLRFWIAAGATGLITDRSDLAVAARAEADDAAARASADRPLCEPGQ